MAERRKGMWYRIIFIEHRDGHLEMDLGYAFLIPFIVLALISFPLAAMNIWTVSIAMWSFLGGILTSLLISAIPRDRARILASSKAAELGASIASSPVEPNMYTDDERGDYTDREEVKKSKFKLSN